MENKYIICQQHAGVGRAARRQSQSNSNIIEVKFV